VFGCACCAFGCACVAMCVSVLVLGTRPMCSRVGSCWIMRVVGGSIIRQFSATHFFLIDVNAVAMLYMNMHKNFQPLIFIMN
jgi:hypothetical protein